MLMWQLSEGMANVDTWITHCNVMLNIGYHLPDIADKMNPFTPTSDRNFKFPQPGASEILHYTVWRTGLSIAFTPMKDGYATDSHYNPYTFLLERLGELRFELGNKRVNSLFFFYRCIHKNAALVDKALRGDFAIPEFDGFSKHIQDIYEKCKLNTGGKVAIYWNHMLAKSFTFNCSILSIYMPMICYVVLTFKCYLEFTYHKRHEL